MVDGEHDSADVLCDYLREHGMTVSTAESCTSGLLSTLLTANPGSSSWYWGGAATYTEDAKIKLLDVPADLIDKHSVYSSECAAAMAEGIQKKADSDIAVAISGIAGPDGGSDENPIGTVYFGLASKNNKTQSVKLRFSSNGRDYIRRRAAVAATILAMIYLDGGQLLDRTSKWQYI
jgi:nicotinamide-nucleotide amidase